MEPRPDSLLATAPPTLTVAEVAALVWRHYRLKGELSPLTSERDQNLLLRCADGRDVVVKIANAAEPRAETAEQCAVLRHLELADAALPVPRLVPAVTGEDLVPLAEGGSLRVVTWLEGTPLAHAPRGPAQRAAIGRLQARLVLAMAGLPPLPADRTLLWDLQNARLLRPLLPAIADEALRDAAARVIAEMESRVLPALRPLPRQPVHNDLNPHNILVDPADPDRICGIIDFGDMVQAPRICDVAVAAAYQVDAAAPRESLGDFLSGVASVAPLTAEELTLLPHLVAARMVATLAIASWRAARYPENAGYILRNLPSAAAGLGAVLALPRGALLPLAKGLQR